MSSTVLITLGLPDGTGTHRMAVQFVHAFRRRGHRVVLVCGSDSEVEVDPLLDGGAPVPHRVTILWKEGFRRRWGWSLVSELEDLVVREGVDCVLTIQQADRKYAMPAARRAAVPCVVHAGNQHTFWGPWPLPALKGWLYGHLLRRHADLVVCTSETVRDEVVGRYGVPAGRTRVQPNGIDVRGFPRPDDGAVEAVRSELGLGRDDLVLVNVGRLDVQKGQDILLRAFAPVAARHPEARLVLVGPVTTSRNRARMARFEGELRKLVDAHSLGSQVVFTGWRDDIPRILAAADGYVHAARWEGPALCLSVLEAMAAELPVVSTDCSGRPGGFEDGRHGFIVAAGAVEPLQEAVGRLAARSDQERRAMGEQARRLALERYDSRVLSDVFVEEVEGVLGP